MNTFDIKRILIGAPFPSSQDAHERLDKVRALAVFASDPISSNAYATESIMSVLVIMGSAGLGLTVPIGLAVAGLVALVVFSYIQTIMHYPNGGGSYMVSKDNLGKMPSLIAAAALLTDYVLTVSVSISAGVRAVTSAFPEIIHLRVLIALVAIVIITWINLRGARESGTIFAIPTYAFVFGVLIVVVIGMLRRMGLVGEPLPIMQEELLGDQMFTGFALTWVVLRAFAGGCTALTGIEAISDGVQAFKPPESKNAALTMVAMGIMALTLFIGITSLSSYMGLVPQKSESILSHMTRSITGGGFGYYWVQFFTAAILFLAANTGYQDFPRLSYFLARDNFMPRWMLNRGDRLVYSSGIIALTVLASIMIIVFRANEIAMLPLYALGVMLSFSLSQSGMYVLMGKIMRLKPGESQKTDATTIHYERGALWKRMLNALGAAVTFTVFIILVVTKFAEGGWIVVLIIPVAISFFLLINHHYVHVADALSTTNFCPEDIREVADVVIVPIADIHRGTLLALNYAKRFSSDVRAVCVITSQEFTERLHHRWRRFPNVTRDISLVEIDYDYRDILAPLVQYIKQVSTDEFPEKITTVVVPAFVPENGLANFLHNQTANRIRDHLRHFSNIVIIDVPYQIDIHPIDDYHCDTPDALDNGKVRQGLIS
jgi:amino acid transporter